MKMKSNFFSLNVKLALMLVAVCGIFASCYEKEEIDVPAPSTEAAKYIVKGVVTNADDQSEVLSGVSVNGVTTGSDGTYELSVSAGLQTITFSKANFKTLVTSINVEEIAKGNTAIYTVNAALVPSEDTRYKTNVYNIEGSVFNADGADVALTDGSVVIPGLAVTVSGNTFKSTSSESNKIQPGSYAAIVKVAGYKTAFANIVISDAGRQIGSGENVVTTKVQVALQAEDVELPAQYFIEGNIRNEKGVIISDAEVVITLNNGSPLTGIQYSNGYYKVEIPAESITPTTVATVRINKNGYYPYASSFMVKMIAAGETSVVSVNATLIAMGSTGDEDGSFGGSTSVDLVGQGNTVVLPKNEVESTPATVVVNGETKTVTVEEIISAMTAATGETVHNGDMSVTTAPATGLSVDLRSDIVNGSEIVKEVDQIVIQPNSKVIFTQASGEGATSAENITVSRDVATERATAAVRTYEGAPTGTVFATPLQVKFNSPMDQPEICFGVMYYNEKTSKWVADANNYATFDGTSFVGNVSHFSKFKFGYEQTTDTASAKLPTEFVAKACYTGAAPMVVTINAKYKGGSMYAGKTPSMAAQEALTGMNESTIAYVATLLTNMIKADNLNVAPKNNYVDTTVAIDKTISAYRQVSGFNITRNEVTKTYTVNVIKESDKKVVPVTVVVKSISSVELEVKDELNHSGHGHGEDLNAGGGIIDFE